MSLSFNQQCIRLDLNSLQEPNWDEVTEEEKLDVYKFRIDFKEGDTNKCWKVLPVILYFAGYCCYEVLKKIKCNSCKNLISRRDNVEGIPEINWCFCGAGY